MKYSRRPGPALATILIISAIDVLLCSFTAGLTLFFFSPSPAARTKGETTLAFASGRSGGAEGIRIIINNEANSDLQYTGGAEADVLTSSTNQSMSALRLKALPSMENPSWLGTKRACKEPCQIPIAATVYVIRKGKLTNSHSIRCIAHGPDAVAIVDIAQPIQILTACELRTPSVSIDPLQIDLVRHLDEVNRKRRQ